MTTVDPDGSVGDPGSGATSGVTVDSLAAELYLDPADIKYTISEHFGLDLHYDGVEEYVAKAVRQVLDRHGVRTLDDIYWPWPDTGRKMPPANSLGSY